ncbi:MAG TPA: hypothetical protein DDZ79_11765 [Aequorivita sp.]|nr:hypothetical protein [Aequorivita sp.]
MANCILKGRNTKKQTLKSIEVKKAKICLTIFHYWSQRASLGLSQHQRFQPHCNFILMLNYAKVKNIGLNLRLFFLKVNCMKLNR